MGREDLVNVTHATTRGRETRTEVRTLRQQSSDLGVSVANTRDATRE